MSNKKNILEEESCISKQHIEFPQNIENYTKEECAKILHRAYAASNEYSTINQLARAVGISRQSIGDYLYARRKPTQERWELLRKILFNKSEEKNIKQMSKIEKNKYEKAKHSVEKLKVLFFLLEDELEYFKNSSNEVRKILKSHLPGATAGYIASLLTALYDEDQLEIFKTFSEIKL